MIETIQPNQPVKKSGWQKFKDGFSKFWNFIKPIAGGLINTVLPGAGGLITGAAEGVGKLIGKIPDKKQN